MPKSGFLKHICRLLLICILCGAFVFLLSSCKDETPDDNIKYSDFSYALRGNELAIVSYNGSLTDVTVPASVNGIPVTMIDIGAFYGASVDTVRLQEGLKTINSYAFGGSSLKEIYIPASATTIGDNPFVDCYLLRKIYIDAGNPDYKTDGHYLMTANGKTVISYAYSNTDDDALIPQGVEEIGEKCFYKNIHSLKYILPSTLKMIRNQAFFGAISSGFEVAEGNTVFSAKGGVLFCDEGKTLYLHPRTETGEYTTPEGVVTIGEDAFAFSELESVTVSEGVKEIKTNAFQESRLKSISFPASLEKVGASIAYMAGYLEEITLAQGNKSFKVINGMLISADGTKLYFTPCAIPTEDLIIPDGVVNIYFAALYGLSKVTNITFPSSLRNIEDTSIMVYNLASMTFKALTPMTLRPEMFLIVTSISVYVPDDAIETYTAAESWSDFAQYILPVSQR